MAICPKCDHELARVTISPVDLGGVNMKSLRGLAYSCPFCRVALSVGVDPITLKADIVDETVEQLRRNR